MDNDDDNYKDDGNDSDDKNYDKHSYDSKTRSTTTTMIQFMMDRSRVTSFAK